MAATKLHLQPHTSTRKKHANTAQTATIIYTQTHTRLGKKETAKKRPLVLPPPTRIQHTRSRCVLSICSTTMIASQQSRAFLQYATKTRPSCHLSLWTSVETPATNVVKLNRTAPSSPQKHASRSPAVCSYVGASFLQRSVPVNPYVSAPRPSFPPFFQIAPVQ